MRNLLKFLNLSRPTKKQLDIHKSISKRPDSSYLDKFLKKEGGQRLNPHQVKVFANDGEAVYGFQKHKDLLGFLDDIGETPYEILKGSKRKK